MATWSQTIQRRLLYITHTNLCSRFGDTDWNIAHEYASILKICSHFKDMDKHLCHWKLSFRKKSVLCDFRWRGHFGTKNNKARSHDTVKHVIPNHRPFKRAKTGSCVTVCPADFVTYSMKMRIITYNYSPFLILIGSVCKFVKRTPCCRAIHRPARSITSLCNS